MQQYENMQQCTCMQLYASNHKPQTRQKCKFANIQMELWVGLELSRRTRRPRLGCRLGDFARSRRFLCRNVLTMLSAANRWKLRWCLLASALSRAMVCKGLSIVVWRCCLLTARNSKPAAWHRCSKLEHLHGDCLDRMR